MLGRFAQVALSSMNVDELGKFEKLLAMADPDIEKWLIYGLDGGDKDILAIIERIRSFHKTET